MATERIQISDAVIRRLADSPAVTELADTRNGHLRFRYHARRQSGSWYLVRHHHGKTKWQRLGRWPELPTKQVATRMPDLLGKMAANDDQSPVMDSMETLGDVLNWYLVRTDSDRSLSKRRRSGVSSMVQRHLLPLVGTLPLTAANHQQLDEDLIWPLQGRYELSTVRQILSTLQTAMRKAVTLKLIAQNPLAGIKFTDFIQSPIVPKGAALRPDDLPTLLKDLDKADREPAMLCWMMLLFGTRIGETRQAAVSEFDAGGAWWHIPAEHTKTKQPHKLPLTPFASDKLTNYLHGHTSRLIFPNGRGGCISETTANQWVQDVSGRNWTAHDLRKLARTCWMDLGVDYLVAEMLLNHKLKRMDSTYIHTYADKKKREALEGWHHRLTEVYI